MRLAALVFVVFPVLAGILLAQESLPPGKAFPDGTYLLKNPSGTIENSPQEPGFLPIAASWGPEVYITDSTGDYYDPFLVVNDTILDVFANTSSPIHFRSADQGDSWALFGNYRDTTSDILPGPIFAFSESNLLYTVWRGRHSPYEAYVYFRSSSDWGRTWPITAELRFPYPLYSHATHPGIAAHRDTAFVTFTQFTTDSLTCWRTTDRGLHWTNPGYIEGGAGLSYPAFPGYKSGIIHIGYNKDFEGQTDIFFLRSTDKGVTWTEPLFLGFRDGNHGQWPVLAADDFGNVAICWMDYIGSPYTWTGGIWVRISHDYGENWGEPIRLDDDYLGNAGTAVIVDGDYLAVAWTSSQGVSGRLRLRESWDGGATWREDQVLSSGWCMVPRLCKNGERLYLAYIVMEYHDPFYINFVRFRRCDELSGIDDRDWERPTETGLLKAYPNPFNSSTTITLSSIDEAEIGIYDITGRIVGRLETHDGRAVWNASAYSSGVYFARVMGERSGRALRLVLIK